MRPSACPLSEKAVRGLDLALCEDFRTHGCDSPFRPTKCEIHVPPRLMLAQVLQIVKAAGDALPQVACGCAPTFDYQQRLIPAKQEN